MSQMIDKIKTIPKLYHVEGCSVEQIAEAETELGLHFPEDYVEYVREYGAISFYRTEWTGLNVAGYINVVEVTQQERSMNPDFPKDCFVIENQGIDGLVVAANESGQVFTIQYHKKELLCNSLTEYLELCISRRK